MHFKGINPILENRMGDLKVSSVLDQGFFQMFRMSPELHSHSYYELLFPADEGFCVELTKGERQRVEGDVFCLIPPGVYHGTCPISDHSKKLAIRFRFARCAEGEEGTAIYDHFRDALSSCEGVSLFACGERMRSLLTLLQEEFEGEQIASKEYLEAILTQFYICLLRNIGAQLKNETGEVQRKTVQDDREQRRILAEEYFQQYFDKPVTEEHMAEKMNLSRRQLSRVLREIYGKSFRQLLIEARLNRAAQLLVTTEQAIEEIAASVGYTSLSGFYSAFRLKFGVSAGQYRKGFLKIQ